MITQSCARLLLDGSQGWLCVASAAGWLRSCTPQLLNSSYPHAAKVQIASYSNTPEDSISQQVTSSSTAADHSSADPTTPTPSNQRQASLQPGAADDDKSRQSRPMPSFDAADTIARKLMADFQADIPTEATTPQHGRRGSKPGSTPTQAILPDNQEPTLDVLAMVVRAVENCKPSLKVKQFRDGNRVTNMPYLVHPKEQTSLAVRWILQAAQKRRLVKGQRPSMAEALATELLLAAQKQGSARARMEEMHRLAVDNRAAVQRARVST